MKPRANMIFGIRPLFSLYARHWSDIYFNSLLSCLQRLLTTILLSACVRTVGRPGKCDSGLSTFQAIFIIFYHGFSNDVHNCERDIDLRWDCFGRGAQFQKSECLFPLSTLHFFGVVNCLSWARIEHSKTPQTGQLHSGKRQETGHWNAVRMEEWKVTCLVDGYGCSKTGVRKRRITESSFSQNWAAQTGTVLLKTILILITMQAIYSNACRSRTANPPDQFKSPPDAHLSTSKSSDSSLFFPARARAVYMQTIYMRDIITSAETQLLTCRLLSFCLHQSQRFILLSSVT